MELASHYPEAPTVRTTSIRVPWFGRAALGLLAGVALITLSFTVVIRRPVRDPFADYEDLFNGETHQAALARGFTCQDTFVKGQSRPILSYCQKQDVDALVSAIKLWIADGVTEEIRFALHKNTLRLGDFMLLWGRPTSMRKCEAVVVTWPEHSLLGGVAPRQDRIDVRLPVVAVLFTPNATAGSSDTMTNVVRHNCRES